MLLKRMRNGQHFTGRAWLGYWTTSLGSRCPELRNKRVLLKAGQKYSQAAAQGDTSDQGLLGLVFPNYKFLILSLGLFFFFFWAWNNGLAHDEYFQDLQNIRIEKDLKKHFMPKSFIAQMRLLMFREIFRTWKSDGIITGLRFEHGRISDSS